ncbi:MAG TPA: S-layer homology domain-containing protein [Anaerolineales bacterium]|nr:S-layer homology domain-containing protein [Anaerolineales bacterium]HNC08495.1 S-layer homology domain-containing protein [Anaerolineales bacterium]
MNRSFKNNLFVFATLMAIIVSALGVTPARAAGLIVNTKNDNTTASDGFCTLREAINNANGDSDTTGGDCVAGSGSDTITFNSSLSGGTITLGSDLPTITTNITIDGSALASQITIDGVDAYRQFTVNTASSALTLKNLTIVKGYACNGGAVASSFGPVNITNSTFAINGYHACGGGGGAIMVQSASLTISNSTFYGNNSFNGGAVWADGTLTITNSTFYNNTSFFTGAVVTHGTAYIYNSTFSANANTGANSHAGGISNWGTLSLYNTIIADSMSDDCVNGGTMAANVRNLIKDGTCSPSLTGDPGLSALASNGGPTQTMAIGVSSPAVDAGNNASCQATDQRGTGYSRPVDGNGDTTATCDIGAYEYGSTPPVAPTVSTGLIETIQNRQVNATISSLGNPASVSAFGVVYNTTGSPTLSNSVVNQGPTPVTTAPYAYTVGLDGMGLTPGTKYYVRAFATNATGTSYGSEQVVYGPATAFPVTAPLNGATGVSTSPTLSWDPSTGADGYEYCYSIDVMTDCASNLTGPNWLSTTSTSVNLSGLTPGTTYGWAVRAVVGTPKSYTWSSSLSGGPISFTTAAVVNHTVTFDGNGADGGSMSPQIASSATNLTANAFTRTGYTFTGWGTAAGGPVVYTDGASYDFSADITLYAQWSAGTQSTTFQDVPASHWAYSYIERLYTAGITGGCGTSPLTYCPDATVTRAQMAIFILRGMHGSVYTPPAATGTVFADVPADAFAADWIEQLAAEGVTSGCGDGNYCPDASITRAQMAIFLLRGEHGAAYTPADAVGTVYLDVPADAFAAAWIEQLAREGVTGGCGGGNYCPDAAVTRAEMAVFIVRAFGLP